MSAAKPITIYGIHGPNAGKVILLCEELNIPYETVPIPLTDVKRPDYVAINPNGRLPSIKDPNTGITLWESGAIIEQWLYYQTTGQGPYFGQAMWFIIYQQIPEARARYVKEVNRVTAVLEGHLEKQRPDEEGNVWFLGGKMSFVDIAFFTWQNTAAPRIPDEEFDMAKYPVMNKWMGVMLERENVKKLLKMQE